jgi:hypothetical protein
MSLKYAGSKLWNSLPSACKNCQDVNEFKRVINKWNILYLFFVIYVFTRKPASAVIICLLCSSINKSYLFIYLLFIYRKPSGGFQSV